MAQACFRFYAELNDFLSPQRRKIRFCHGFERKASIKDMIESFGVPHTEIDLILVDGLSVDFSWIVTDGNDVSVYPVFERLDVMPLVRLRPTPLRQTRFVVDVNLGRLARYLRLLGFDTLYRNDFGDKEIAVISSQERRILLTRDRTLLRRKIIIHGCFVHSDRPREQLGEVVSRLDLYRLIHPFSRCILCNGALSVIAKESILDRLEPGTRRYYDDFLRCENCGQLYWRGSHYQRAMVLVGELMRESSGNEVASGRFVS